MALYFHMKNLRKYQYWYQYQYEDVRTLNSSMGLTPGGKENIMKTTDGLNTDVTPHSPIPSGLPRAVGDCTQPLWGRPLHRRLAHGSRVLVLSPALPRADIPKLAFVHAAHGDDEPSPPAKEEVAAERESSRRLEPLLPHLLHVFPLRTLPQLRGRDCPHVLVRLRRHTLNQSHKTKYGLSFVGRSSAPGRLARWVAIARLARWFGIARLCRWFGIARALARRL